MRKNVLLKYLQRMNRNVIDISLLHLYNKMHQFFVAYFGVEATSLVSTLSLLSKGEFIEY